MGNDEEQHPHTPPHSSTFSWWSWPPSSSSFPFFLSKRMGKMFANISYMTYSSKEWTNGWTHNSSIASSRTGHDHHHLLSSTAAKEWSSLPAIHIVIIIVIINKVITLWMKYFRKEVKRLSGFKGRLEVEKCFHLVKHIITQPAQLFIFLHNWKERMRLITWHVLAFSQFILRIFFDNV